MTIPSALFPSDGEASPLLCLRVKCNVDELFKTLFVDPALQAQLHKLRSDTNFIETCWLNSKDALPKPQYTWEAPADSKLSTAAGRWRKVRFESPPTAMASKPFQNEEIHCCTEYKPGQKYTIEMQANTSAPYGDKFDLFFRANMFAASDNPSSSILQIVFTIQWTQAVSWMLKPVVTKAVEGGVRGAYKQYRQALEGMHAVEDLPETSLAGLLPEVGAAPAVTPAAPSQPAAVPATAKVAAVTPTQAVQPVLSISPAAPSKPLGFMEYAYGQLVWNEQVSVVSGLVGEGLRTASSQSRVARVMAAVVTLALIHAVVTVLHNVKTFCSTYSSNVVVWTVCTPVTYFIPLPDSLPEVLVSLLLVAGVNWAVIRGAQASMSHVRQTASPATQMAELPTLPLERDVSLAPGMLDTPAAESASTPADTTDKAGTDKPAASATAGKVLGSGAPIAHVSKAGPKRADIVPPKGRSQSKPSGRSHAQKGQAGSNAASTQVVAPAVKAIAVSSTTGTSSPATASAATTPVASAKPAVQQMEMTVISSPPAATELQVLNAVKKTGASSTNVSPARTRPGNVSAPQSVSNLAQSSSAGNASSKSMVDLASMAAEVVQTSSDKEKAPPMHAASSPLNSQPVSKDDAVASKAVKSAEASPTAPSNTTTEEPTTDVPPLPRSTTPDLKPTCSPAASQSGANTATTLVVPAPISVPENSAAARNGITSLTTASNSPRAGGMAPQLVFGAQYPPGAQPQLNGNPSGYAWMKSVTESFDALSEGFRGAFGMSALAPNASDDHSSLQAPSLDVYAGNNDVHNGLSNGGSGSSGHNNGNHQVVGGRYPFTMPIIGPETVEEEVFENERIQPFRGWGHTWPGHFLPSDRVGHWSDALGRPGGAASMMFEQVEPTLPPGYEWAEDEWQLDMEGLERDAVDEFGWTYAFDFQHLKHPPVGGAGKYTALKHFVRRRRWFRTRVRTGNSMASMSVANMHDVQAHEPGAMAGSPAAGLSTTSEPISTSALPSPVGNESFSKSFGGALPKEQTSTASPRAAAFKAGFKNMVGRAVASASGSPAQSRSSLSGNTKQLISAPDTDDSTLHKTTPSDEAGNRPSITIPDGFAPQPAVSPAIASESARLSTEGKGTSSARNSLSKSKSTRESSKGGGPPSNSSQPQQVEMEMSAIAWNPAWDIEDDLSAQHEQPTLQNPPSGSAPLSALTSIVPTTGTPALTETASVPNPPTSTKPGMGDEGDDDDLSVISQAGKRVSGQHGLGATRNARHAALGKATDRLLYEASSSPGRSQASSPSR